MQADFQPQRLSEHDATRLLRFVEPLVRDLDKTVDKRPVRTLVQAVEAIIAFRDRCNGLVLSQLGSFLDGLGRGGGTKRLSTLIHHQNWKAQQIEEFLLNRADEQLSSWQEPRQDALLIWDGTVLEKPESLAAEGLCAVRSSKAKRLTHVKKGYYHPCRHAHLCARDAWDGAAAGWQEQACRTPSAGGVTLVDVAWRLRQLGKG